MRGRDAQGMEALARYVRRCTVPEDRVLALGYIPELFFMSHRRFARAKSGFFLDFSIPSRMRRLMIERTVRYRVPIAITVPDPEYSTDYVPSFLG
jgi:hypothetical protein